MILSVIVPVKVSDISRLGDFRECYQALAMHCGNVEFPFEIVIVNSSSRDIYELVDGWFADTTVLHMRPDPSFRNGRNDKLNSIEAALSVATGQYVLLLDDDCRPTIETLTRIRPVLDQYDCLRFMVKYDTPTMLDLVNACGIFGINIVCEDRQFWGNIAFNRELLLKLGFPCKDALFDELTIDRQFRLAGKRIGYISSVAIKMVQNTGAQGFLKQRVRYAYENLAYPFRFLTFLSVLPLLLFIGLVSRSLLWPLVTAVLATFTVTALTLIGQHHYSRGWYPPYTFMLAPIWFWFYPFTSWIAIFAYLRGGVSFGGNRIHRPA